MSLEDGAGSSQAQAGGGGNPNPNPAGGGDQGSANAAVPDWVSGLQGEGNRAVVEAKGWKTPDDFVRSYRGLEGKIGEITSKSLVLPGEDAKPEDWAAFHSKLGRPEKPDDYSFKLPEGLPENFPYEQDAAVKFKNWAHANGLTPRQAQGLHDTFIKDRADQMGNAAEALAKRADEAHKFLEAKWGPKDSEPYNRNLELAKRSIRMNGGEATARELAQYGVTDANGNILAPHLALMLANIGKEYYAEDLLYGGVGTVPNPFAPGPNESLKGQGDIFASDPSRARQLARAAGWTEAEVAALR